MISTTKITTAQSSSKKKKRNKKKNNLPPIPKPISAPIAKTRTYVSSAPKVIQRSLKSCRFQHREFVDPLVFPSNTSGFILLKKLPLNPGIDDTFSWLSNIALGWERYKFHKLTFHFVTRSPATLTGSIIMSPDYDAADVQPIDELTAMSYEGSREDVVWKDMSMDLPVKSLLGGRLDHFVRSGPLGPNLDIKTYDSGNLWIFADSSSVAATQSVGKLFVEYDVEFFNPQLPPTGDPLVAGSYASSGGTMSLTAPLGTAPINSVLNTLGDVIIQSGNNQQIINEAVAQAAGVFFGGASTLVGIQPPTLITIPGSNATVTQTNGVVSTTSHTGMVEYIFKNLQKGDGIYLPTYTAGSGTPTGASWHLDRILSGLL